MNIATTLYHAQPLNECGECCPLITVVIMVYGLPSVLQITVFAAASSCCVKDAGDAGCLEGEEFTKETITSLTDTARSHTTVPSIAFF